MSDIVDKYRGRRRSPTYQDPRTVPAAVEIPTRELEVRVDDGKNYFFARPPGNGSVIVDDPDLGAETVGPRTITPLPSVIVDERRLRDVSVSGELPDKSFITDIGPPQGPTMMRALGNPPTAGDLRRRLRHPNHRCDELAACLQSGEAVLVRRPSGLIVLPDDPMEPDDVVPIKYCPCGALLDTNLSFGVQPLSEAICCTAFHKAAELQRVKLVTKGVHARGVLMVGRSRRSIMTCLWCKTGLLDRHLKRLQAGIITLPE